MGSPELRVESEPPVVRLIGTLALETATSALDGSRAWLGPDIDMIDLSGVDNTDSSAVALLLEWQRIRPELRFTGTPAGLLSVAKLSDLQDAINFA